MSGTLLRGARLADGTPTHIRIVGRDIAAVAAELTPNAGERVVDADGLIALPGLVDLHTHLREPGGEGAETVLTGSRAAAAGGYTMVFAMPNTEPAADKPGVVEQVFDQGRQHGYVDVQPIGAVTKERRGEELAELGSMAASRAAVRVFSDDGDCVADPLVMRRALEYVSIWGGVIAQHAQEPRLTQGAQLHEGAVSAELGLAGWPAAAEESIIARDVLLAGELGARLHVCHLSTAGSVELVRWAKARGVRVTAEVTPHHLLLTHDEARSWDPRFKVNPPLRTAEDVAAVRAGLADGTIDVVGTDHAPHPAGAKRGEWAYAANGMIGLESALSVVQAAMVETGLMDWSDVARVLSSAPAAIGGDFPRQGGPISAGGAANLVLVDPAARREFGPADIVSRSANSPFLGRTLPGRVVWTFHDGYPTVADGRVVDAEQLAEARRAAWA